MQKSNVQQKDELKDELKVEFTVEFKEKVELKDECSKKDDLKDDIHRRLQVKYTQNHDTNTSNSRPSSKKTTFCQNFPLEDLELSIFCHIFALRKDIRQAHSFTHIRVLFETMRYL